MAEISDVCLAMAQIIEATLFPNGPLQPSIIPGLTGACGIFQNWPTPSDIDDRVLDGSDVLVAVVDSGQAKPAKRYPVRQVRVSTTPITLEWTVAGNTATISGEVTVPQNLVIEDGDGNVYAYGVQAGDTLETIASNMAALIPGATVNGAVITAPTTKTLIARVGGFSTVVTEKGRQRSIVWVMVFAPTDALRAAVVKLIQPILDDARRINDLPDGTTANIFAGSAVRVYDPQKLGLAQTTITYAVEFGVTEVITAPQAIAWKLAIQGSVVQPVSPTEPPPINITV